MIKKFDKDTSFALKGIAISMMILHHLFRKEDINLAYQICFFPFSEHLIRKIAESFKICVSIYAFISGYGLYKNYKISQRAPNKWVISRSVKLLSGYWFVMLGCCIVCQIIDKRVEYTYFTEGFYIGIQNLLIEFLGCANLFKTVTLCDEWWYMSAAFVFIILLPLIVVYEERLVSLLMLIIILPRVLGLGYQGGATTYSFLFVFVIAIMFAKHNIVDRWLNWGKDAKRKIIFKFLLELIGIIIGSKVYMRLPKSVFWEFHFGIFPIMMILFIVEFIAYIPLMRDLLIYIGKHSMNIYLIHTFVAYDYMKEFVYNIDWFVFSYMLVFMISLGISIIIETIKKGLRYNQIIENTLKRLKV